MNTEPSQPRILVLLAAFNGAKWISEQIDSILRQQDVDVHIVIGDDASSDATRDIVAGYGTERITLIAHEHSTGAAGQNFFALIRTVDALDFDYVGFSDQDDIWHRLKLSRAAQTLRINQSSGYSSATTAVWPNGRRRILAPSLLTTGSDFLFESAGQGCTYLLAREFYNRARDFIQERRALTSVLHYHDWTVYALARAWRLQWTFDTESTVLYRQHIANDTGAKASVGGVIRRLNQISNGWYTRQLIGICRLVAEADPSNPRVQSWQNLILARNSFGRRIRIAGFCFRGARRKLSDRMVLIAAALFGWI